MQTSIRLRPAVLSVLVAIGCSSSDGGTQPEAIQLAIQPERVTIAQGDSSSVAATLIRVGSFTGSVTLVVSGAPVGVTATVSNDQTTGLVTSATVSISVSAVSTPGSYRLMLSGTGAGINEATTFFALDILEWPPACPRGSDVCGQWAASATASSQYDSPAWDASQAAGEPNVVGCADDPKAWASLGHDTVEWLELTFPVSVRPTELRVYEVNGVSSIVKVEVKDVSGAYQTVYTAQPGNQSCPRVLNIPVTGIASAVNVVRLTIDQRTLSDWNEIDAVKLIGRM